MYCSLDDLKSGVSEKQLLQMANDGKTAVTVEMLKALEAEGDLGDATEDEQAAAAATLSVIDQEREQSQGEIDGYCARRLKVPLEPVPPFIKSLAVTITVYRLYARKAVDKVPEVWQKRYDAAVRSLENISKGVISLGVDPEPATSQQSAQPAMVPLDNSFSRSKLRGL